MSHSSIIVHIPNLIRRLLLSSRQRASSHVSSLTISAERLGEGGGVGDVVGRVLLGHQCDRGAISYLQRMLPKSMTEAAFEINHLTPTELTPNKGKLEP